MLCVDPQRRRRLEESIRNLGDRIEEARVNGWPGRYRGSRSTSKRAQNKLASLDCLARNRNRTAVSLGMPIIHGEGRRPRYPASGYCQFAELRRSNSSSIASRSESCCGPSANCSSVHLSRG